MNEIDDLFYDVGTPIAIWGSGNVGRAFYDVAKNIYDVKCFIDNKSYTKKQQEMCVISPEMILKSQYKIVIAIAEYEEVVSQCLKMGLEPFFDFVTYDVICGITGVMPTRFIECSGLRNELWENRVRKGRKVVTLIGNCHIPIIKEYLLRNEEFIEHYILTQLPPVHVSQNEGLFNLCLLISDIVITQPISNENKCHSMFGTENVKQRLNEEQQLIIIPNLYFEGYFFSDRPNTGVDMKFLDGWEKGIFPEQDLVVKELANKYSCREIVEIVSWDKFVCKKFMNWNINSIIENLQYRERKCDIKMADFIKCYYQQERLFYSIKHPTNIAIKEEVIRLLRYLNIDDFANFYDEVNIAKLDFYEEKIYPSVYETLGLNFYIDRYRVHDSVCLDFENCIKLYVGELHNKND